MGRRRTARALRRAAGALAALLAAAAPLRADDDPPEPRRTTPPAVVEAVRPAELPDDPSSFTTVIDVARYEGEIKTVEELIGDVPGVQLRRFGGPGQPAEVSIRGSTASQVVVLLDGVRLNDAQSGSVDLSTIPASLIERIEVSRGGGSVQTGSDAIGGVVNLITRRADATPRTNVRGAGGSFDTWQGAISQTGRLGDVELVFGYDYFESDGDFEFQTPLVVVDGVEFPELVGSVDRINNHTENHAALWKLARDFGERVRVTLTDDLFFGSAGRPGPAFGSGATALQSPDAHQRRTRNLVDVKIAAAELLGGWLDATLQGYHRFDRSRYEDDDPPSGPPVDSDNRNHAFGGRAGLERRATLGFSDHRASLGVDYRHDLLDAEGAPDRERDVVGVFAQDEVRLWGERLTLVPALRFDQTEGFGSEWIPRLGLIVTPLPWLRFRANVERSYRVPNFDELFFNEGSVRGDPNLDPEEAIEVDGGFELGFERIGPVSDVRLEVAGFYRDIEESIVFQLVSSSVVAATNTGDAYAAGLEVAGAFRLLDWIGFAGNYTFLDTEQDSTNASLPGRARNELYLRLEIGPPSGLVKLVGERRHTGRIPATAGGVRSISARTTYDASLTFDFAKWTALPELARLRARKLAFSVSGTNLSDRSVRDAQGFPQPGRTLMFQLEGAW